MNAYLWLKLVHVISAIIAVGSNLTYFLWLRRAQVGPARAVGILEGIQALDRRLANPAYGLLALTGIAMVLVGDIGFSTFWIATAIVLYIAVAAFAGALFSPALRRQVEAAQAEPVDNGAYGEAVRRTTLTGIITMIPVAAILYLMVMKPTL